MEGCPFSSGGQHLQCFRPCPPGLKFTPSDQELMYYLSENVQGRQLPCRVIIEDDLYREHPKTTTERHEPEIENIWYFFTPRDRRYANGHRPNRSAGPGYWKPTEADRPIYNIQHTEQIGIRKSLVYHEGKQPTGQKTLWMMTEYRLMKSEKSQPAFPKSRSRSNSKSVSKPRPKLLDGSVLCKVYYKPKAPARDAEETEEEDMELEFDP